MIIEVEATNTYIPKWHGNQGLEGADQIVVTYQNPTMPLYNSLIDRPKLTVKTDEKQNVVGGESVVEIDNAKIVKKMVISIKNLSYKNGSKEVPIVNGAGLFDADVPAVFHELIDELGIEMQKVLARTIDSKN